MVAEFNSNFISTIQVSSSKKKIKELIFSHLKFEIKKIYLIFSILFSHQVRSPQY